MVPGARIELATPAFSGRRSTSELPRHVNNLRVGKTGCVGFYFGNRHLAAKFNLACSLLQVAFIRDVVPIKNRTRFVTADRHTDLLRHAAPHQPPYCTSPKVMHLKPFVAAGGFAIGPFLGQLFPEAGSTAKRIPIFPRLGNAAAIFPSKYEITLLLATHARGQKRFRFLCQIDFAAVAVLAVHDRQPIAFEQINVADAQIQHFGLSESVVKAQRHKGAQPKVACIGDERFIIALPQ